jgi:hypothetical protein
VLHVLLVVDPGLLSCSFVVVVVATNKMTYLSFFSYYVAQPRFFLRHIPSSLVAERMNEFKDHDAVVVQVT